MTSPKPPVAIAPEAFAQARLLNTQINRLESGQGCPVVTSRPLRVGLDISNVCNVNCIFCLARQGRLSKNDADAFRRPEWLDHFEPVLPFVEQAIFSSYEALLNPWFEAFVARLRAYATPFQVFSNGLAISPDRGAFLLENGCNSLWISFHGAREKTYQSIMRGSDYATVLRNLMALKLHARKYGRPVEMRLVFCAMRRTLPELLEFVDLAKRVGATAIQVNYLLVTEEGQDFEEESVFFHQELYDHVVTAAKRKAAGLGIGLIHQPLFSEAPQVLASRCFRPWEHLNIARDGSVQVCCGGTPVLGNMFEEGFARMWNAPKMLEFRARVNSDNPPAACRACTRGRENPGDILTHLTYLRRLPPQERQARIAALGGEPWAMGKTANSDCCATEGGCHECR